MLYALLFIVALSALIAALLCEKKVTAVTVVFCAFGVAFFVWGIWNTSGIPDELVEADDMTRIWTGLALVVVSGIMAGIRYFVSLRSEMPRK